MKTFAQYIEMRNHLGEVEYGSWGAWMKALKQQFPNVTIEGDKDIASAFVGKTGVGEWDGMVGVIYYNSGNLLNKSGIKHEVRPIPGTGKFGIWQNDIGKFASAFGLDVPDMFNSQEEAEEAIRGFK